MSIARPPHPDDDPEVLLFGEVLWDLLPTGEYLGGAPLNVAWNLQNLGVPARIMSSVGEDERGWAVQKRLEQAGMSLELLQTTVENLPTGTAEVMLDEYRIPTFTLPQPVAYDDILPGPEAAIALATVGILYYGTLATRRGTSKHTLQWLWNMAPNILRFCDLNLRAPQYSRQTVALALAHADVLKINEEELVELSRMDLLPGNANVLTDVPQALMSLGAAHGLRAIFLTRGPQPLCAWHEKDCPQSAEYPVPEPSDPTPEADTIGAGDAFCAGVIQGLVLARPWEETIQLGLRAAAAVCGVAGAQPDREEFLRRFERA